MKEKVKMVCFLLCLWIVGGLFAGTLIGFIGWFSPIDQVQFPWVRPFGFTDVVTLALISISLFGLIGVVHGVCVVAESDHRP